jgi:hypothetical protein
MGTMLVEEEEERRAHYTLFIGHKSPMIVPSKYSKYNFISTSHSLNMLHVHLPPHLILL